MKRRSLDTLKVKTEKTGKEGSKERATSQTLFNEVSVAPAGAAKALNVNRKFYRDPPYGNLMFDPRVCRGSPYAHSRVVGGPAGERLPPRKKRAKESKAEASEEDKWRPHTPPPAWGRQHVSVQTDRYLEKLFDYPPTTEVDCQTDLFLDRPSSPYYVTEKVGEDVDTQIYPGDLWDFDREVHPILEVLVGRTIELGMIEVFEEDEIENMKAQQRAFEELREGERAEQRRLEEQERRLQEEKERRIRQFKEAMRVQQETLDRIAAAVLTQGYLADLLPHALEGLTRAGYLLQDIRADMEEHVIPWLSEGVDRLTGDRARVGDILTSVVRGVVEARAETYRLLGAREVPRDAPHVLTLDTRSESEEGEWHIKDMGPEEREPTPQPEIPMKGTILVPRGPMSKEVAAVDVAAAEVEAVEEAAGDRIHSASEPEVDSDEPV